MTVATRATKTGLVAPFVNMEVAVLVGVEDMPVVGAPDAIEGESVGVPPVGAVDWPLNVPLMPAKLFKKRQCKSIRKSMRAHANMAEKASAGEEPFVYDSELKRMKLTYETNLSDSDGKSQNGCLPFVAVGPHGRAGVNVMSQASGECLERF